MYTYQMVGVADENGREYESKYGVYSKDDGFMFNEEAAEVAEEEGWRGFINILFHEDLWKLKKSSVKEMTLKDIEKELGYRIRIVNPSEKEEEYNNLSPEKKAQIDREIDFFRRLFGIEIDPKEYY